MEKKMVEFVVNNCGQCPFLDEAKGRDLCHYCGAGKGGEIPFARSYLSIPSWCPLRNVDYTIKTNKRQVKTKLEK
jgi:hypothetical protein